MHEVDSQTGRVCFEVVESTMSLRGDGTYHGRTADGQRAIYVAGTPQGEALYQGGPLELVIDSDEHFIGIEGTYGTQGSGSGGCDPDAYAEDGKVPATFTLHAANHVHDEDEACTGDGQWWRVSGRIVAEWSWDSPCTVEGNEPGFLGAGTAPAGTEHRIDGSFDPCIDCPEGEVRDHINVDFNQTLSAAADAAGTTEQSTAAPSGAGDAGDDASRFTGAVGGAQAQSAVGVVVLVGASVAMMAAFSRRQRLAYDRARSSKPIE